MLKTPMEILDEYSLLKQFKCNTRDVTSLLPFRQLDGKLVSIETGATARRGSLI